MFFSSTLLDKQACVPLDETQHLFHSAYVFLFLLTDPINLVTLKLQIDYHVLLMSQPGVRGQRLLRSITQSVEGQSAKDSNW